MESTDPEAAASELQRSVRSIICDSQEAVSATQDALCAATHTHAVAQSLAGLVDVAPVGAEGTAQNLLALATHARKLAQNASEKAESIAATAAGFIETFGAQKVQRLSLQDMPGNVLDKIFYHLWDVYECGSEEIAGTCSARDFPNQATFPLAAACRKLYAHYRGSFVRSITVDVHLRTASDHAKFKRLIEGALARFPAVEWLDVRNRDAISPFIMTKENARAPYSVGLPLLDEAIAVAESDNLLEAFAANCPEEGRQRIKRLFFSCFRTRHFADCRQLALETDRVWSGNVTCVFRLFPNIASLGGDQSLFHEVPTDVGTHPMLLAGRFLQLKYFDCCHDPDEHLEMKIVNHHISFLETLESIRLIQVQSYPAVLLISLQKLTKLKSVVLDSCHAVSNMLLRSLPPSVETIYLCNTGVQVGDGWSGQDTRNHSEGDNLPGEEFSDPLWKHVEVELNEASCEGLAVLSSAGKVDDEGMSLLANDGRQRYGVPTSKLVRKYTA